MPDTKYVDFNLQLQGLNRATNQYEVAVLPSSEIEGTREPTSVKYDFDEFRYDLIDLEGKSLI